MLIDREIFDVMQDTTFSTIHEIEVGTCRTRPKRVDGLDVDVLSCYLLTSPFRKDLAGFTEMIIHAIGSVDASDLHCNEGNLDRMLCGLRRLDVVYCCSASRC